MPQNVCTKEVSFDGAKMSFPDAGHVLGSKQLLAQTPDATFLYTGDFKTQSTLWRKARKRPTQRFADGVHVRTRAILVPPREQTYAQMKKWVENGFTRGEHSVWGYALGKSQELIKFLNDYCQITPVVNPSISLSEQGLRKARSEIKLR